MYLKKDIDSNLNKIFASNVSKTLMYFENLPAYGSFSNIRVSQPNLKKKKTKTTVPRTLQYKKMFTQKAEIPGSDFEISVLQRKYISPKQPISMVIINCAMPPAMESVIALIRLPSATKRIRPAYSPIRLGVFSEKVTPHKTDLNAVIKDIGCNTFISTCHFRASRPQLIKTHIITSQNFQALAPKGKAFISATDASISGCTLTCRYRE
jgi:hypothetical protein